MTTGEQLRDEGVARANEDGTVWRNRAEETMEALIRRGKPFSANEFNALMDASYFQPVAPKSPAAIGSLFSHYAKYGRIVRCGTARPTKASSHARTYALWISADAEPPSDSEADQLRASLDVALDAVRAIVSRIEAEKESASSGHGPYGLGYFEGLRDAAFIIDEEIKRERS